MRRRRGTALVIVVVLTAVLLLVAGSLSDRIWRATRSARLGWQGERATHLADAALLQALSRWAPDVAAGRRVGETDTVGARARAGERTVVVRSRVSARSFALEASARVQDGGVRPAERRIGRVVHLEWPSVPAHAALTSTGSVEAGPTTSILGADAVPAGWDAECDSDRLTAPTAALRGATATFQPGSVVAGWGPSLHPVAPAEAITLGHAMDAVIARVQRAATVVTADSVLSLDAVAGTPACPRWFGDARRHGIARDACTRRWPVVVVTHPGETRLTGRTPAQGVLVVQGDLRIDGPVSFAGVLLVGGRLHVPAPVPALAGSARSELVGAVLVRDRLGLGSRIEAPTLVQTSRCAARMALAALGVPRPQAQHGWALRP